MGFDEVRIKAPNSKEFPCYRIQAMTERKPYKPINGFQKELAGTPLTFDNGTEAWLKMAPRPWPHKDEPLSEVEQPYLFVRFPVSMTQTEKIKTLQAIESGFKEAIRVLAAVKPPKRKRGKREKKKD